ncbi:MAG: hypothetical protein AABZ39_00045 [Spirochaetota bacterium]
MRPFGVCLILALALAGAVSGADTAFKDPVAVFPFRDPTGRFQPVADRISDSLAAELARITNISIVPPRTIEKTLTDMGVRSTALSIADIAMAGNVHGVDRAISGVVHQVIRSSSVDGTIAVVRVTVTLTRIGIDETEAVSAFTANASAAGSNETARDEALSGAVAALIPMIVNGFKEHFAERIRVTAVEGDVIHLSAGADTGIRENWRFRIIGATNTATNMPRAIVRKASVKVISVTNGASAVIIRGGTVAADDIAERIAMSGFRFGIRGGLCQYDVRPGIAPVYVNYLTNTNAMNASIAPTAQSLVIDASLTYTGWDIVEPSAMLSFFPGNFTFMTAVFSAQCDIRLPLIRETLMLSILPSIGLSTTFGNFGTAQTAIALSATKNIPSGRAMTINGFGAGAVLGVGIVYDQNDSIGISAYGGYRFWTQLSPWYISAFNDANESVSLAAGIPAGAMPSFSLAGWFASLSLELSF